jgi:peroxiredoxin
MLHKSRFRTECLLAEVSILLLLLGCNAAQDLPGDAGATVQFKDQAPSNAETRSEDLLNISLQDADGQPTVLDKLRGNRPVVLVFTRGLVGSAEQDADGHYGKSICTYCSTQTSRLIANYDKFRDKNAEVIVVFPVARSDDQGEVQTFAARVQGAGKTTADMPFPVLLDVDLKAVDALGIRADLSKPSTFILDADGKVRYAYVGQTLSDRPSINALLEQLDEITDAK